jgi:hypothetical protein
VKRLFSISARIGFLALISVAHLGDALAWPPTYGLELNLESHALEKGWSQRMNANAASGQTPTRDSEHRIARELMEKLREACKPDCSVTEIPNGKFGFTEWKFRFASGFGSLATPMMALVIPVPQAAAIMLPLLMVMDGATTTGASGSASSGMSGAASAAASAAGSSARASGLASTTASAIAISLATRQTPQQSWADCGD